MAQPSNPAPSLRAQTRFSAVPDWVTFHPDLSAYAVRLYSGLMRYADKDTGVAFPRRETLATKLRMSERTVDAAVKELQAAGALSSHQRWTDETGEIFYAKGPGRRQTSTEYTVLVVPALAPQEMRGSPHAQPPQEVQANDSHLSTSLNERPRSEKATRLPPDWAPSAELADYAGRLNFTPSAVARMAEDFRDYWIAKPGRDGTKLDWAATWRTWVRREADRRGTTPAPTTVQKAPVKYYTSEMIKAEREQLAEETFRRIAEMDAAAEANR